MKKKFNLDFRHLPITSTFRFLLFSFVRLTAFCSNVVAKGQAPRKHRLLKAKKKSAKKKIQENFGRKKKELWSETNNVNGRRVCSQANREKMSI